MKKKNAYRLKFEDYGGGFISYVIYKNGKAIFHSNGWATKKLATFHAKRDIKSMKLDDYFSRRGK